MPGETNLQKLLGSMSPELLPDVFVFVTLPQEAAIPDGVAPLMTFREREGLTLIVRESEARAFELPFAFPSRMITLNVHSSLEAVGFLAVITTRLAAAGMGVNPISAYFHDHLFVPSERADEAMQLLLRLVDDNRK
ncbi:MAG: ACT domain-containing protein [Mesorhizobium sp.]|nr:ACT domain-containing protein [Mesorhizobium sp.]MBL8577156.1 ACT domain-containing protein [Mesorhizobium sp.]